MSLFDQFTHRYGDRSYKHTTMVRHKGTLIAFAMDDKRRIFYATLDLVTQDKGALDKNYWPDNPEELAFPEEIAQVGYGITDQTLMPLVKKGSREEAPPDTLQPEEIDGFLSSTARLTADVRFQVLSDDRHVYIFRQAITQEHEDMVYKLVDGSSSGQASDDVYGTDAQGSGSESTGFVKDKDGNRVPVAHSTLLVDRFILVGSTLQRKREVRYRRSRSKNRPASHKDSLGATDLEGRPFYEPTQELDLVRNLVDGRFSVLLLPTQVASVQRWQLFAFNGRTGQIDSLNIERSADGLFNTRGTQFYTSPDPEHQKDVFERQPGTCPYTREPLIPLISQSGYAEWALEFSWGSHVETQEHDSLALGDAFTLEAWVRPFARATPEPGQYRTILSRRITFDSGDGLDPTEIAYLLALHEDNRILLRTYNGERFSELSSQGTLETDTWSHIAGVLEAGVLKIYINGRPDNNVLVDAVTPQFPHYPLYIGGEPDTNHWFEGSIDEIRIWNAARSQQEIGEQRHHRLLGNESQLVGYWRFDEGSGDIIHDQTDHANHGLINGTPTWVISDAPVGDHPGLRRTSFGLDGRSIASGLSGLLYHQQERAVTGYQQAPKPLKKNARVMLAAATIPEDADEDTSDEPYIAVLDFAVSREGRLAQIPDNIRLPLLNTDVGQTLDDLSELERKVETLRARLNDGSGFAVYSEEKLPASAGTGESGSGYAVAVSEDTAIVGAPLNRAGGVVHIFKRENGQWVLRQLLELEPTEGWDSREVDWFGCSVGISGKAAIVGGYRGAAHIFEQEEGQWIHKATVQGDDTRSQSQFGRAVDIDSDYVIIGAAGEHSEGPFSGAAYIFQRENGDWVRKQRLQASDSRPETLFGCAVAIHAGKVVVGATGSNESENAGTVTIFQLENGQWIETDKLQAGDGDAHDHFGHRVAASADEVIVATRAKEPVAYVFQWVDGEWLEQKLAPNPENGQDLYGETTVAIDGDIAVLGVIGNYADRVSGGAAYIFQQENGEWVQRAIVQASDRQDSDDFGSAVALSDGTLLVGAAREDTAGQDIGAAYVYHLATLGVLKTRQADVVEAKAALARHDTRLAMPLQHVDPMGLTMLGGLLGFAYTRDTPQLFDSATGKLALYFRGLNNQFFTAYYDTEVVRAQYALDTTEENVTFLARSPAAELGDVTIEVSATGSDDECRLTITFSALGMSEFWQDVPRDPTQFERILNGQARERLFVGTLVEADADRLLLQDGAVRPLERNDVLQVGSASVLVSQSVDTGAREIPYYNAEQNGFDSLAGAAIYYEPYNYQRAWANPYSNPLENGSLHFVVNANGARGQVENGRATLTVAPVSCHWVANAPGSALSFDGYDDYCAVTEGTPLTRFDAAGDMTLEAWINPRLVGDTARIIHHHSDHSRYALGVQPHALPAETALTMNGTDEYASIAGVRAPDDFTLEAWIYLTETPSDAYRPILTKPTDDYGDARNRTAEFNLQVQPGGRLNFFMGGGAAGEYGLSLDGPILSPDRWYHVAVTMRRRMATLYVDGQLIRPSKQFAGERQLGERPLLIGHYYNQQEQYWKGHIDDVRLWNFARREADIDRDRRRRLAGNEPGLLGYWHFEGNVVTDYSRYGHSGEVHGRPRTVASPPALNNCGYTFFAGVSNRLRDHFVTRALQSTEPLPCGQWNHLAAAFSQSYALRFDGNDFLQCESQPTLDITRDLTLEIFIQVDTTGQRQGILGKGRLNDGTKHHVPYALYLEPGGTLAFTFEDKDGNSHVFRSNQTLKPNKFYRVAVTRQCHVETSNEGTAESARVRQWADIRFYLREAHATTTVEAGAATYTGTDAGRSGQPLIIGKVQEGVQETFFNGFISEARIWNKALSADNACSDSNGDEEGLISWWRCEENEGNIAYDSKSNNHATIKGAKWSPNPDPHASSFVLYRNGTPVPATPLDSLDWGTDSQFMLGGLQAEQAFFDGEMEEVRVWNVTRTQEEIQDNLFTRLKGEKTDLIAYYTFDDGESEEIKDHGLRGNHLVLPEADSRPTLVLSTAPISDDAAQVRSALARIKTQFHDTVYSQPAVQEYGDVQYDSRGSLIGVMKRCYGFVDRNGHWQLITGYKVGNLVREWIGQVQADPQIKGFIEGAPPVPSENLTGTGIHLGEYEDYSGASLIELVEADLVNYIYAASKEDGFDTSVEMKAVAGFKSITMAGFVVSSSIEESKIKLGLKSRFEYSNSQLSEASISYGRNTAKASSLTLGGAWERAGELLNPAVGKRFQPRNVGMALVQSDTMDMFALRLVHNNALVCYQMAPNPDIPPDWNIIIFPINPTYVKQGTLDGKVGINESGHVCCDPDYPGAAAYGEWSYFKPTEAYALKKRIERERQELQAYYEAYRAEAQSGTGPGDIPRHLATRNLVNTYVWTAEGGFFSESTESMETVHESSTGSYSFSGMAGLTTEMDISIMKGSMGLEIDALFGGHLETIKSRARETERTFGLKAEVSGEHDIQLYATTDAEKEQYRDRLGDGGAVYDETGRPIIRPGKVNAYRFMTFYLEPRIENFEDFFNKVVDPIWLEQSHDPNAIALRQAQQMEKKPACWRVLHRVTFISRVLPEIPSDVAQRPSTPEQAMRLANVESNWELIKKLEPYVRNHTGSLISFADAVCATVATYLPELKPYTEVIIQNTAPYFGVPTE